MLEPREHIDWGPFRIPLYSLPQTAVILAAVPAGMACLYLLVAALPWWLSMGLVLVGSVLSLIDEIAERRR